MNKGFNPTKAFATSSAVTLILGDQLFDREHLRGWEGSSIFMCEDWELASRVRHHKMKIAFFFTAMRQHACDLREAGWAVEYREIEGPDARAPFEEKLADFLNMVGAKTLRVFEIEDKYFEQRIRAFAASRGVNLEVRQSPMFLTAREEFYDSVQHLKKPLMKDFYVLQRRRLNILLTADRQPLGQRWSFDADNRETLPKGWVAKKFGAVPPQASTRSVCDSVEMLFPDHPGSTREFWMPVTRAGWRRWLDDFIDERLIEFGPYEDALSLEDERICHSALTPALNTGLLTPREVVDRVLERAPAVGVPMRSMEGFIRQVIGWREFVRGVYQTRSEQQEAANAWGHRRLPARGWWTAETGIPPIDAAIRKALRLGWTHHIERLMVLSSAMFLCEMDPRAAHGWFMEMFVDSADWVMGPNVYGMGQNSDGGLMTTKPYLCGSNYLIKMGRYAKGPWTDELDGLYWRWILKNQKSLLRNPRMAQAARSADRLEPARRSRVLAAGERALARMTMGAA